jgi:hypothetical protein
MLQQTQDAVDLEQLHNIYVAGWAACGSAITRKIHVFGIVYFPIEGELIIIKSWWTY